LRKKKCNSVSSKFFFQAFPEDKNLARLGGREKENEKKSIILVEEAKILNNFS